MTGEAGPTPTGPNISIETRDTRDGRVIQLTNVLNDQTITVSVRDPDIVRNRCSTFGEAIADALDRYGGYDRLPPTAAGDLLEKIAAAGRVFLTSVLPDAIDDGNKLSAFFLAACPLYGIPDAPPPIIEVRGDDEDYFPWELLPLFNQVIDCRSADQVQLETACRAFLGFSVITERRYMPRKARREDEQVRSEDKAFLSAWDGLPIRVIYNAGYEGARRELGFFRARTDILLEGPYPRSVGDPAAPPLGRQLGDPRLGIDGTVRLYSDEVVHLMVHCNAQPGKASDEYSIHMADENGGRMSVRLFDVQNEMYKCWIKLGPNGADALRKPMVFFNSCGSAVLDPAAASSFISPFYRNRNRCIIATWGNVSDRLAATLSRWFYTELFAGATVGQALYRAKWRILQDWGNLMGILYSIHDGANLQIQPVMI
jgi:hypothetical protein